MRSLICSARNGIWSCLAIAVILAVSTLPGIALADEIRPALLELSEREGGWVDVIWKVPMRGDRVLGLVFDGLDLGLPCREMLGVNVRLDRCQHHAASDAVPRQSSRKHRNLRLETNRLNWAGKTFLTLTPSVWKSATA